MSKQFAEIICMLTIWKPLVNMTCLCSLEQELLSLVLFIFKNEQMVCDFPIFIHFVVWTFSLVKRGCTLLNYTASVYHCQLIKQHTRVMLLL